MKAWVVEEFKSKENLILKDIEIRNTGPSEVKIKIKACGINNKDIYIRRGMYYRSIDTPVVIGSDIAGIVEEVGSEVSNFKTGDRVLVSPIIGCGQCQHCRNNEENKCDTYESILGGFAEKIVLNKKNVIKIPEALTLEQAAALPISYLTAWNMLFNKANVCESDTVLFWGASSGVGTAGILLLNNYSNVIAVAGSGEKLRKLKELGVTKTINYKTDNLCKKVMEYTDGKGVDIIFDPVGKAAWNENLQILKNNGKHINCARNTGSEASIDLGLLFSKQIAILGAKSGTKTDLINILDTLASNNLSPVIDKVFNFHDAEKALQYMEAGNHFGKVILKMEGM